MPNKGSDDPGSSKLGSTVYRVRMKKHMMKAEDNEGVGKVASLKKKMTLTRMATIKSDNSEAENQKEFLNDVLDKEDEDLEKI